MSNCDTQLQQQVDNATQEVYVVLMNTLAIIQKSFPESIGFQDRSNVALVIAYLYGLFHAQNQDAIKSTRYTIASSKLALTEVVYELMYNATIKTAHNRIGSYLAAITVLRACDQEHQLKDELVEMAAKVIVYAHGVFVEDCILQDIDKIIFQKYGE